MTSKLQGDLLSTADAAALLNITPQTLRRYRCSGEGPPFVYINSKLKLYSKQEVMSWVQTRKRKSTSDTGEEIA